MLNNYKEATTITASSMITVNEDGTEKQVQVAYMSASISDEGTASITKTISNKTVYAANKDAVRADFAEFESKVYAAEDGGSAS